MVSRLFRRMADEQLSLGAWVKGGPHLVQSLAKAGFDFVRPDPMYSAIDWKELDHILRTCEATGMTCWPRLPSNPWAGETMQVTVDAQRAFSLGIPVVQISVSSVAQVRALLEVAKDWHRSGAGEYPNADSTFTSQGARVAHETLLMPAIECRSAIDAIDEILELDGLQAIFLALTDFSDELGYPMQYNHPEVWKAIDQIVSKARGRNVMVAANTGYDYKTPESILGRVQALYDHGIRAVLVQGAEFLLETYSQRLINSIRSEVR